MKKGYWVVAYRSIADPGALQKYGPLARAAIEAAGGRTLVRTADAVEAHEAGLQQRVVVIEFESFEKALSTYRSAASKEALKALGSGVERDFRIVEGDA